MKELQWHEPAAYRRGIYYENERHDPLSSLKFAGTAFLIVLGLRFLAGFGPDAHPPPWPPSVGVAAGIALFAAYGLPAIMSLIPGSIVILSDKGINNNVLTGRVWSIRCWSWDEIAACASYTDTVGGRAYPVVAVLDHDGETLVTVALAPRVSLPEVEAYLVAHGRTLTAVPPPASTYTSAL